MSQVNTDDALEGVGPEGRRRHLDGSLMGQFVVAILLSWAAFQIWYASPLPYMLGFGVFNDTQARSIHLAFAIILVFLIYPAFAPKHGGAERRVPIWDVVFAFVAAFAASYLFIFSDELAMRPGAPTTLDIVVGISGLILLLEAARRALGPSLTIVALVFLTYSLAGPYMPEVIAHKGVSVNKLISHQWLGSEGVFGIAVGVSAGFVFLFVAFGSLLEKAGAGLWFIRVSFSLLGHLRGGPAKAAVVASGLSGVVSGSSIANVVTTGTFTIPLMKRVGFPGTKAGAVEVAASTNGQLTPPVMGAAAFLMVEYVGIPYIDVIRHAILPAAISYIALIYIVHLEAMKAGMQGLPREKTVTWPMRLAGAVGTFVGLSLLTLIVYYGIGWIKDIFPDYSLWIIGTIVLAAYIGLVAWAAGVDIPEELDESMLRVVPSVLPTMRTGSYFLLPVILLIWCLAVERLSPGLAAFWATMFIIFIVLTHKPLRHFLRKESLSEAISRSWNDLLEGLMGGSRNMIAIGVATATAGIVVGTVTQTGIGLVMTEFVEFISGGNLFLMLLFTAVISLLLGLGLPTTANYIVVSTLMAPVIVSLGAQHGLVVPLIAVHLFVFYFGILADDTPPVGLAAFAASAIARSDPIKTGVQGFGYDIRTAVLPFMFIFNTQLLLMDIGSAFELFMVVSSAIIAMLCFAAATQGWWFTRNKIWETLLLLLVAFSLFRPGFWWDEIYPPLKEEKVSQIQQLVDAASKPQLVFDAEGITLEGEEVKRRITIKIPFGDTDQDRLDATGLRLMQSGDQVVVDTIEFGSPAEKAGLDIDWAIKQMVVENERPNKYWLSIPIVLFLVVLGLNQRRRARATAH